MPKTNGLMARPWNGVSITRRVSDGYVNATAMCKAGGKKWFDYLRLDRTQAYIAALEAVAGNPTTKNQPLIQTIQGGSPRLQGTWVHPRLAVDLARWIAPAFAVWIDGWFLEEIEAHVARQAPQPQHQPEAVERGSSKWWQVAAAAQRHGFMLSAYLDHDDCDPGDPGCHRRIRHHARRILNLYSEPVPADQLKPVVDLLHEAANRLDQMQRFHRS
jgi:hypothetical protein